jgi:hypothetical protein
MYNMLGGNVVNVIIRFNSGQPLSITESTKPNFYYSASQVSRLFMELHPCICKWLLTCIVVMEDSSR